MIIFVCLSNNSRVEQKFDCRSCNDQFRKQAELDAHMKDKHPENTEQCPKCKNLYKSKTTIERHEKKGCPTGERRGRK